MASKNKNKAEEKKGLIGRLFGGNDVTKSNEQDTSALQQEDKQPITDHESINDERIENLKQQTEDTPLPVLKKKPANSFSQILEENKLKRAESNKRVLAQAKERYNEREEQTNLMTRSSGQGKD